MKSQQRLFQIGYQSTCFEWFTPSYRKVRAVRLPLIFQQGRRSLVTSQYGIPQVKMVNREKSIRKILGIWRDNRINSGKVRLIMASQRCGHGKTRLGQDLSKTLPSMDLTDFPKEFIQDVTDAHYVPIVTPYSGILSGFICFSKNS